MLSLKKILPITILIAGLILFFVFGGQHYLSLQALSENYKNLQEYTHAHYFLSVLAFMGCYIVIIALSIPGATLLTLLGGFLFGAIFGTLWVIFAATIGATITFLAVNTAFGELLRNKVDNKLSKMKKGFTENAFNYLITLRLLPIFPFFVINIAAGIIGMPLRTFFFGTLLGIIPGSFIYAWVGSGLGYTLEQGKSLNLGIIFEPQVIFPIIGLAILSLAPVIVKKYKARRPKTL
ncbi:VTT domain-containing protein [Francisellaceae bacterium]|nr:VTT domain-containing protein [Francisellaceae bacterium]